MTRLPSKFASLSLVAAPWRQQRELKYPRPISSLLLRHSPRQQPLPLVHPRALHTIEHSPEMGWGKAAPAVAAAAGIR